MAGVPAGGFERSPMRLPPPRLTRSRRPCAARTHGGWGTENSLRAKSPSCQRTSHVIAKPVQRDRRTGDLRLVGLRSRPCGDRDARSHRRAGRPRPGDRTGSRADRRHGLRPRRPQCRPWVVSGGGPPGSAVLRRPLRGRHRGGNRALSLSGFGVARRPALARRRDRMGAGSDRLRTLVASLRRDIARRRDRDALFALTDSPGLRSRRLDDCGVDCAGRL